MDVKKDIKFNSLRSMAKHFRQQGALVSKETAKDKDEKEARSSLPALSELSEGRRAELDEFEEYIEFPRLDKFKTYKPADIRPRLKSVPARNTQIECEVCDLKIELKNVQFYESVPLYADLQPFVLKNSHAVFYDLKTCDKMIFYLDQIGNTVLLVEKDNKRNEINLGCIVRFEFDRPGIPSLLVNSSDVKGDVAVLGAPCEIQFLQREDEEGKQPAEKADLLELYDVDKAVLRSLNIEAGLGVGTNSLR
ncbi:MAG: hypothetical protein HRT88_05455 [Lentisphaeraceae bacterium]|nr:hypothetical protein [Lentisphaeraceae bacterium]